MEVAASCLFEYPNGLSATASVDVLRSDTAPTHGDDWARVVGTRAILEVRNASLQITDEQGVRMIDVPATGRTLVGDLLDAIALGAKPWIGTAETLALTQTLLDTRRSADEGRRIDIAS
jgi:predicted dehydrogenase